ncbi:MCD-domain-containing protein [Basidiobolus meristosporus CBS 931.73]|uniref:MCD-domain-containing protein n=1 Tax=Basidiobolus meristosporus CBS 931.73 TaxID=1314790 RepID=A0A1Y1XY35_9FUNG|nr:MCD-domain-containing protein [Basidiobolus meristosporus CBS 931.73]|eukprot:ORX90660.1 MCD-domain-containing protein [Basidiobolus meristosporus CBS 931.73]
MVRRAYQSKGEDSPPTGDKSTKADGNPEIPQHERILLEPVRSNVVKTYWKDISNYTHEPGLFLLGESETHRVVHSDQSILDHLRSVINLNQAHGDLIPPVVTKNCCELYESLDKAGKKTFLRLMSQEFGPPREAISKAARHYINATNNKADGAETALLRAQQILNQTLVPPYNRFFDHVNKLPGGMRFLVDMRSDMLDILSRDKSDLNIASLSDALKEKLQNWLLGFLELERITWNSPAATLEKLAQYEAVHAFSNWADLKRRVGRGRRCFGFFHRSMPNDPLVFVQVALVTDVSDNVQKILNDPSPGHANPSETIRSAIFYSITSQRGLSGVELGNFLIKRVVGVLKEEFPQIHTFCTLSPIPKFKKWLENQIARQDPSILLPEDASRLAALGDKEPIEIFKDIIHSSTWFKDPEVVQVVKEPLMRLCARYLLCQKRGYLAYDPVANFHIRNGACVHRINWLADTSDKGILQSLGMMVNYNYVLSQVESNNHNYLKYGTIAVNEGDSLLLENAKFHPLAKV